MTVTCNGIKTRSATNDKGVRSYVDVYSLMTSDRSEGAYAVGSHTSLPRIGAAHYDDPYAWCIRLDVNNVAPWAGWEVTASYSSEYEVNENPLNEPARITITGEKYQEVAQTDRNGDAVLNSAGDPFVDPPVMRDKTNRILHVQKNVSSVPSWFFASEDAVNSADIVIRGLTVPERCAKLENITMSELQERNGIGFYVLTFDLHLRAATWNAQPLQAGFRELVSGVQRKITTAGDGTDITTPALLDAAGAAIDNPDPADASYANYELYNELDFTLLPLD